MDPTAAALGRDETKGVGALDEMGGYDEARGGLVTTFDVANGVGACVAIGG